MNNENAHEYLPLIQALIEGKQIQYFSKSDNTTWHDLNEVYFDSPPNRYRIKPKPIILKSRRFLGFFNSKYYVGIYEYSENTVEPNTFAFNMGSSFVEWIDQDWVEYKLFLE